MSYQGFLVKNTHVDSRILGDEQVQRQRFSLFAYPWGRHDARETPQAVSQSEQKSGLIWAKQCGVRQMLTFPSVLVADHAFLGTESVMFGDLLIFVARLSVVLWSVVILTTLASFLGVQYYQRKTSRAALTDGGTSGLTASVRGNPAAVGVSKDSDDCRFRTQGSTPEHPRVSKLRSGNPKKMDFNDPKKV